ncbi:hypothetical protein BUALT_Bualt15G0014900 [Buddleja alternifolia]|uniref:tRNA-dihydrouridine(47) synthase [NAD(P)(+)] n=1 Tax=Buddleja alternifolia TaxID=168488 RepID=A0AAV6WD82_9LAMI|nr:hypothetical protein BUALT_Bualt15G0014900 [Buddleja alternifolia]
MSELVGESQIRHLCQAFGMSELVEESQTCHLNRALRMFEFAGSPKLVTSIKPTKCLIQNPPPSFGLENVLPEVVIPLKTPIVVIRLKKNNMDIKHDKCSLPISGSKIVIPVNRTGNQQMGSISDQVRSNSDIPFGRASVCRDQELSCELFVWLSKCSTLLACSNYSSIGCGHVVVKPNFFEVRPTSSTLNKQTFSLVLKECLQTLKARTKICSAYLSGGSKNREDLRGQAKKPKIGDNENGGRTLNGSGDADGNGCCRAISDSSNGLNCSAEVLEEDKPDEADVAHELRPPKKPKCSSDEPCSVQLDDGQVLQDKGMDGATELESVVEHTVEDNDKCLKLHPREKKLIDFREKLYLAPLTTVGNLPYRRVCKTLGADVTCGEMAMCTNLLQGQASEWALLRRHSSEDLFGVQICGPYPDTVSKTVELIEQHCTVDFIDINMGCPIDIVVNKGAGSALLTKPMRMKSVVEASSRAVDIPVTIKVRTGYFEGKNRIDSLIADMGNWGASAVTVHGRTRQQRYSKLADWDYIYQCARAAPPSLPVIGNGDVFSYLDWNNRRSDCPQLSTCMIARGALIKPWIFTEIKEQRHWDISSGERLNILKDYVHFGLEHWGSDSKGVETTRHFLLEWLSYTCRYVPVGLLDVIPQRINWRPPSYFGRDDLETLMASDSAADWIRITEMLLGKVPSGFTFAPKHKSNAYDRAENG